MIMLGAAPVNLTDATSWSEPLVSAEKAACCDAMIARHCACRGALRMRSSSVQIDWIRLVQTWNTGGSNEDEGYEEGVDAEYARSCHIMQLASNCSQLNKVYAAPRSSLSQYLQRHTADDHDVFVLASCQR